MEILFINRALNGGGSEKAMTLLANEMSKLGHKVYMVLLYDEPHTYYIDDRIELIECFCPIEGNKILWHIRRILSLRKVLNKNSAKYVISFMWDINMKVILASIGLGKRIIASERCDPNNEKRKSLKFAMHFILPFAYHTVFQTSDVKKSYPKIIQNNSTIIPNMVTIPDNPISFEKRNNEIVAVGRLVSQKNYPMLISAFSMFHSIFPEYVLKIYGTGILKDELMKLVEDLEISNSVIFKGYCKNILEEIKHSKIYVNSSNFEGISNAMLEAMSLGLVCICTDCPVGGARFTIKNNENGILIPINNRDMLFQSLKNVAGSSELQVKISQNAINSIKRFSPETISNMWLEILK